MISKNTRYYLMTLFFIMTSLFTSCTEKFINPQFESGNSIPDDHGFIFGRFQLVTNLLGDGHTGFTFRKLDTQEIYKIQFTKNEGEAIKALLLPQGTYRIENLFTGSNGNLTIDSKVKTVPLSVSEKLPITVFSITPKTGFYLGDFYLYKNNVKINAIPMGKVSTIEFGISNFLDDFENTKKLLLEKFPELGKNFSLFNLQ